MSWWERQLNRLAQFAAWTPAPAVVAPLTVPTGITTVNARYVQIGNLVFFTLKLSFTTGTGGTKIDFTLPVECADSVVERWAFSGKTVDGATDAQACGFNKDANNGTIFYPAGWTGATLCTATVSGFYEAA